MTLDEALAVRTGDYVTSRYTSPPLKPLRVTQAWQNERRTIVQFRIFALGGNAWIDRSAVERTPKGKTWSAHRCQWEDAA